MFLIKNQNKITMKKFIMLAAIMFASFTAVTAQKTIAKMDSTRSSVTVQPQNYTYSNVYVVITNISVGGAMYMPSMSLQAAQEDSINVSATAILYASKSAFEAKAQQLTTVQLNVTILNTGILPTHYQLKEKFYAKL